MTSFDAGSFDPAYAVEVNPEFPGNGEWDCPSYAFGRDGGAVVPFRSVWGTPTILRVEDAAGHRWVGMFPAGGLSGVSGVLGAPAPNHMLVVVDGLAYLVDVTRPEQGAVAVREPVTQVVPVDHPPLLLLVDFSEITAIGPDGVAWETARLCVDELHVQSASEREIVCSCTNIEGIDTITLDPTSGAQTGGPRMQDFWPPDALA